MELLPSREILEDLLCYYYGILRWFKQQALSQRALTGRLEVYTTEKNHVGFSQKQMNIF
jgi:hypothetical protein